MQYLCPPEDSWWRWDERGEVVLWSDGAAGSVGAKKSFRTLAFRQELVGVIERFTAGRGVPPLTSVLFVLGAFRDDWSPARVPPGACLRVIVDGLTKLHSLPAPMRYDAAQRARMIAALFEGGGTLEPDQRGETSLNEYLDRTRDLAEQVVEQLSLRLDPSAGGPVESMQPSREALAAALRSLDPEALLHRIETGVDRPPASIRDGAALDPLLAKRAASSGAERSVAEAAQLWIRKLQLDPELGGLAQVAQRVRSLATLPRAVRRDDSLSVGGVSDIAPRGPLDRLLVSELAHDDEVLSSRVALREALYLRREAPPRPPTGRRCILLDNGVRSWGLPRLVSTAVALALVSTSRAGDDVSVCRASGSDLASVDLQSRAGLLAHLRELEPTAHPGLALPRFFEHSKSPLGEEDVEIVIVTHASVLADPEFRAALIAVNRASSNSAGGGRRGVSVFTVTRDGQLQSHEVGVHGPRLLRQAAVDLAELGLDQVGSSEAFRAPRSAVGSGQPTSRDRMPVLMDADPFPLLLPVGMGWYRSYADDSRIVVVTRDGRLMNWSRPEYGARQLDQSVPSGTAVGIDVREDVVRVLLETNRRWQLYSYDLARGNSELVELAREGASARTVHFASPDLILVVTEREILHFDVPSGARTRSELLPPGVVWRFGRFFENQSGRWSCLPPPGQAVPEFGAAVLMALPELDDVDVVRVFDRAGRGPWVVKAGGKCFGLESGEEVNTPIEHGLLQAVIGVSNDGSRIMFADQRQDGEPLIVNLVTGEVRSGGGSQFEALHPLASEIGSHRPSVHRRFVAVDRHLRLVTRNGSRTRYIWPGKEGGPAGLEFDPHGQFPGPTELLTSEIEAGARGGFRDFQPVTNPATGRRLSVARWPNGSAIFLDPRGLLHLVSADPLLPEVTLVLTVNCVAGYSTRGGGFGTDYFSGPRASTAPGEKAFGVAEARRQVERILERLT